MKIALGTIEVSDLEREALGASMSLDKKAGRTNIGLRIKALWEDHIAEITEKYAERKTTEELTELEERIAEMEKRRAEISASISWVEDKE